MDRYALRALVFTQRQQPEECRLCEADQRAELRRRTGVSLAPQVCPPMLRWRRRHTRMRCHIFASGSSPDKTANCDTPHHKVWMRHATNHTANNVASCSKPSKTQERCLHERQRGRRAFLCDSKPVTEKKCKMTRACGDGHNYCMFFFCQRKTCFARVFLYRPRMKLVQQVPHKLTVHTTSACWELKSLRLIPIVWAEREALLFAPILRDTACIREDPTWQSFTSTNNEK